jgi:hypothetical protein
MYISSIILSLSCDGPIGKGHIFIGARRSKKNRDMDYRILVLFYLWRIAYQFSPNQWAKCGREFTPRKLGLTHHI